MGGTGSGEWGKEEWIQINAMGAVPPLVKWDRMGYSSPYTN